MTNAELARKLKDLADQRGIKVASFRKEYLLVLREAAERLEETHDG